ncbi:O-antigen ligase family protein [Bacteroides sp. 519]|uniref:O-antigen ligase family protein n=1 Tax=Bacteroides sp. 519 TaxID=2302937 RepID=UPI0013D1E0EE|nr:O-antigen ligase family protein [Bacteroides sp. 519]NDV58509.1 hypothetical protein [Bacteroides sp. 519]
MPNLLRNITSSLLLIIGTIIVLGTVCITYPELSSGETAGQLYYIGWTCIIFCIAGLVAAILSVPQKLFYPKFSCILSWILIGLGSIQAIWGLRQIYGFTTSNHSLFNLTGSFFNPGPYSGYLAMVLPICLYEWLRVRKIKSKNYFIQLRYYISLLGMLLIVCVLPAGMSRSAWIAAVVSCCFVCSVHYSWFVKLKHAWSVYRKQMAVGSIILFILLGLIVIFLFSIKKDSASGRLFMWKISTQAILQKPLTGHGANSFAIAYGNAQETYFASGNYTEQEELVAGSPEYAFNEYLHIALEWGIPVLVAVLLVIFICLYLGIKKQRIGISAAIISLLIFAFSSYPFQLPVFVITFIFLLTACVLEANRYWLGLFALSLGFMGFVLQKDSMYKECCKWTQSRMLYQAGAYESAIKEYAVLYPSLKRHPAFLFEYGHAHHKRSNYVRSTEILKEAAQYSCDPMIFNVIGKNYQEQGQYEEAEYWLLRSTNRLPGRIYPYYLLAKLYAEPAFYQQEKFNKMAELVLTKEPKVQSTAIRQMREEIQKMVPKYK